MSTEKKSRVTIAEPFVGKTGSYRIWGNRNLSRHILTFVCVADQLLLRRCCRLLKKLADEWWEDPSGMIRQFWLQFTRETEIEPEDMDKIRKMGGFYCSPILAGLIQPPRVFMSRSYNMSFDSYDFILPHEQFEIACGEDALPTSVPDILRDGKCWKRFRVNPRTNKVHAATRLDQKHIQFITYNDKEMFRPHYETNVVITAVNVDDDDPPENNPRSWKIMHKYRVVDVSPKEFVNREFCLPWERCCFDGKRLFIADVGAFISKMATFKPRILMPPMSDFRQSLDSSYVDLIQKWKMLGFTVIDNPNYPLDPKLPGFKSNATGTRYTLWEMLMKTDRNYNFPTVTFNSIFGQKIRFGD